MKYFRVLFFGISALSLLASGSNVCLADAISGIVETPKESMIQIGGGAAALGNASPIEALFRVDVALNGESTTPSTTYVIARIRGNMASDFTQLSYVDLDFQALGQKVSGYEGQFIQYNLLNANLQRNIAINNAMTFKLTFVGLSIGLSNGSSEDVEGYLRVATSLLSLGYSQRLSDGQSNVGFSPDVSMEGGVSFQKKYRIAIGGKFSAILDRPYTYNNGGISCNNYNSGYSGQSNCYASTSTVYYERRILGSLYLNLVADLTKSMQVFGAAQYNVYSVQSDLGEFANSTNSALQFMLGVNGNY